MNHKKTFIITALSYLFLSFFCHPITGQAAYIHSPLQNADQNKKIMVCSTSNISLASISGAKKYLPPKIYHAFCTLRFKIKIKNSVNYNGIFSVRRHSIILKYRDTTVFLHEMGHFTALLAGSADYQKEWRKIYKAERSKYHGRNRGYATHTPYEYFAESFREYCTQKAALKKERPLTFAYLKKTLASIDEDSTNLFWIRYHELWE